MLWYVDILFSILLSNSVWTYILICIFSKLRHPNIVLSMGYSTDLENEEVFLISELVKVSI